MEYDSKNNRIISVQHTLSGYFYEWMFCSLDLGGEMVRCPYISRPSVNVGT